MPQQPSSICFIALQPTGPNASRDTIQSLALLNPEYDDYPQVLHVPPEINGFAKIAKPLLEKLSNIVLINYHPHFTLALLKQAYARFGFRLNVLCQNLPGFSPESLTAVEPKASVESMYQFYQAQYQTPQALLQELESCRTDITLPPHLKTNLDDLPDTTGVYVFYDKNRQPIYIGKSIHIKQRIRSHFANRYQNPKSLRLFEQAYSISTHLTKGEFGALILESQWVKKYKPLFNRKLRKTKRFYRIAVNNACRYLQVQIEVCDLQTLANSNQHFGIFSSFRRAELTLDKIINQNNLCAKWMGREKISRGPCFHRQLKRCLGACTGEEAPEQYNQRVLAALAKYQYNHWPYQGALVVHEHHQAHHVFLYWRYLGTATSHCGIKPLLLGGTDVEDDLDATKLLQKFMRHPENVAKTSVFYI